MWHLLASLKVRRLCAGGAIAGIWTLAAACILSIPVFAGELRAKTELATVKAYQEQQAAMSALQNEKSLTGRIGLAKELDGGLLFSSTNPLRQHRTDEAVQNLKVLAATVQGDEKLGVQKLLYDMLSRSALRVDREASKALLKEEPLVSPGESLISGDQVAAMDMSQLDNLKKLLASGSARAGFRLAELLAAKSTSEAKIYREQALYLAAIDAQSSANSAVFLATLYIDGTAGVKDGSHALTAIESAMQQGSDDALGLMDDHFNDLIFAGRAAEMRELIEEGLILGSDRAAELIVMDQIEAKRYGFSIEDAIWVVGLLDEIKSSRSFYVSAKLYAEGKLVERDLKKAEKFLIKLSDVSAYADEYQYLIGKRILSIDMPAKLHYRYALPIFLRMMAAGREGAVNRVANMVNGALRDGYFGSVKELPIGGDTLISELKASFENGDLTSGVILGDIYKQGLIVPQNTGSASKYYVEVLSKNTDRDLELRVGERYARILRRDSRDGAGEKVFLETLRSLAEGGNLWAKKEYGSLLLAGIPGIANSAELGIDLMLQSIDAGYYSASTKLLKYAMANERLDVQRRVISILEGISKKSPSPELIFELANAYSAVGRFQDANLLLERPEFADVPEAMFLRSKLGLATGTLTLGASLKDVQRAIKLTPTMDIKLLKYAKFILSNRKEGQSADENALGIVSSFADLGDYDAITAGLKYMQQDIESHQDRFSRILPWVVREAVDGRPELLLTLVETQMGKKISAESNLLLAQAVLDNFEGMRERGSANALLARIYSNGFGVPRSEEKAMQYLAQATRLGNQSAFAEIGIDFLYGVSEQRNTAKAEILFEAAAALGSNKARIQRGRLYSAGFGNKFSELQAFANNQQAAEAGSLAGMIETARAYLAGAGIEKNVKMGLFWLEKAANKGSPVAASQLYFYYFIQDPSTKNQKARFWLDKAIEYGHSPSLVRKAVVLQSEDPVANAIEVQALLNESIATGHNLARRYQLKIAKDGMTK